MQQYPEFAMRRALKILEVIKVSAPEAKALSGRANGRWGGGRWEETWERFGTGAGWFGGNYFREFL